MCKKDQSEAMKYKTSFLLNNYCIVQSLESHEFYSNFLLLCQNSFFIWRGENLHIFFYNWLILYYPLQRLL